MFDNAQFAALPKTGKASATSKRFGIDYNDCCKASLESMAEAWAAGDATLLRRKDGSELTSKAPSMFDLDKLVELVAERLGQNGVSIGGSGTGGTFTVKRPDGVVVPMGRVHKQMKELLAWTSAGCYPFLVGPAGSFKTSAARAVADAMGIAFHVQSQSEGFGPHDIMGYKLATGELVRTPLREAWEFGGVFLVDEADAGNANAMTVINMLLSQDIAAFPDGQVARHPMFHCMFAGNTAGSGADAKFVGRNQLDGATLDRLTYMLWEYDEDFEVYVAGEDMQEWTRFVQKARKAAALCGVAENVVFATPRASINGAKMLRQGVLTREAVELGALWKGMSPDDVAKVKAGMRRM